MGEHICKCYVWRGLISKVFKEFTELYFLKNPVKKKWAEDLNTYFSKNDMQTANRHMKRCSASLIIREMQIKTTKRYLFTPVRKAILKRTTNNKYWQRCEKGTLLIGMQMVKPLWKIVWSLPEKLKIWPNSSTPGYISEESWERYTHSVL